MIFALHLIQITIIGTKSSKDWARCEQVHILIIRPAR
jgi:hypothetical protein